MSVRRATVDSDPSTFNVTKFCMDHGATTYLFWNLRRRYRAEGDARWS